MYSYSSGSGRQPYTHPSAGSFVYQPQQQHPRGFQSTHGYQTLRPQPINTGFSSSGHTMNRTSSYGSIDSGYATRTPSVASPTPQQSYPTQNYLDQTYAMHGYGPSRQPSGPDEHSYYGNQSGANIEVVRTAPVSSSKHKKERRISNPPSSPSEYPCLHPNCGHISSRAHDLKRHMTVHFPPSPEELLDCKYEWCGRVGAHGFKRQDHRKEHYRNVHMKEDEYPKRGNGGRSGRSSGRSGR